MAETQQAETKPSRTALVLTRVFQIFIVLCLLDGFLDVGISAAHSVMTWMQSMHLHAATTVRTSPLGNIIEPMPALPAAFIPGAGNVSKRFSSEGIHIDDLGMRSNGIAPPPHPRATAYLLGSSPAFGYKIPDNETLPSYIERDLGDVRVMNFAGFPQTLPQSVMRYRYVAQHKGKPDFVIIAGAITDLFHDCFTPEEKPEGRMPSAVERLYRKAVSQAVGKAAPWRFLCTTPEAVDLAINNSIYEIDDAVRYFRSENLPLYLFVMPTPYEAGLNVQNLLKNKSVAKNLNTMGRIYALYRERLKKAHPEVIDLSQVLPAGEKMYFIDPGAHTTGPANEIIAAKIAESIRKTLPARNLTGH